MEDLLWVLESIVELKQNEEQILRDMGLLQDDDEEV